MAASGAMGRLGAVAATVACLLTVGEAQAAPLEVHLRDRHGAPVVGAVVALERAGDARPAKAGARAALAQRDRQFDPRVLVVQTGTEVVFPNHDKVRHHVYSFSATKSFELELYLGKDAPPVRFDKAGVVALGCNIHDRMSAHIVVVDTPSHARSDAQGVVRFDHGGHTLRAWHPQLSEPVLLSRPAPAEGGRVDWVLPL